jgi:hypothetical protein
MVVPQPLNLLLEQPLEPLLAFDERQLCRAMPVQKQEIEGEEHELIPSGLHPLPPVATAFSAQSSPSR